MNNETLEIIAQNIYLRQRDEAQHRDGVNARRPWRSPDVPNVFWDGYLKDARVAIETYLRLRNEDIKQLASLSGEE